MLEASELLPAAEVVTVSARTGEGIDELRAALDRTAGAVNSRADASGLARLHVDRAFTIRGSGTVVTGTLWSGQVQRGDEVVLLPGERRARVRGVQVHDQPLEVAAAGQRVALNLTGVSVDEVRRGDVVVAAASNLRPGYLLDAQLEFSGREPEHGDRVQIHHGTREAPARLAWLGGRFWQIRLEQPLVPAAGDRVVVRQIAPPDTLGGGRVLDPHPRRHGPGREVTARLERLSRGEVEPEVIGRGLQAPRTPAKPAQKPLPGSALEVERRLREAGVEPPLDSELDARDLAALRQAGRAVRVTKGLHYHADTLKEIRGRVIEIAGRNGGAITLAQLRDELATSRKFAQALLEHFDSERVTIRRGDEHLLRRRQ
jgi:selenocysteine-specific elongation factor